MNLGIRFTLTLALLATSLSTAALAEPRHARHDNQPRAAAGHCPPGLAKKSPPCVPPGQARKQRQETLQRGDRFEPGRYSIIDDPRRYGLDGRSGWDYYRDGERAYRVDRETRRVLAVINLIDAFTN
nr:hypothetical protein [Paracoccus saliphilus]